MGMTCLQGSSPSDEDDAPEEAVSNSIKMRAGVLNEHYDGQGQNEKWNHYVDVLTTPDVVYLPLVNNFNTVAPLEPVRCLDIPVSVQ